MRRRTLGIAAAAAGMALGSMAPTAAMAGEVTGTGEVTGMVGNAASECGYSGLEDLSGSPLRTQTPHAVFFGTIVYPVPGTPGAACNPTTVP